MKIHIANNSKQSIGGGWTFLRTFEKYAKRKGVEFSNDILRKDTDVMFISGATMADRGFVNDAKAAGKKIVLRVDNIPRNSRNRNTGTSRLYDFAQMADLVIYQSQWAKDFIMPFIKKDGPVILNGADTEFFHPEGHAQPKEGRVQFGFCQYNRDETKQWHQAWYDYILASRTFKNTHLWIIGNFSKEHQEYNFDFFMGEKFRYVGVIENPADMAEYYRSMDVLLLPYYNDACSNTLIEALMSGAKDVLGNKTGGNLEIMDAFKNRRFELDAGFMTERYLDEIEKIL